jgi:hypothetical protein
MKYKSKPGIDWHEVRERYQAGESANGIAKTTDVSRQAIMKRAKKENWQGTKIVVIKPGALVANATDFTELLDRPKFNAEKLNEALEAMSIGANHAVAAALSGISIETWRLWRQDCPRFRGAIEAAQAHNARKALLSIDRAAETDWKAAERQLASNPLTKEDYAKEQGSTGIQITFNINRASTEDIDAAHTIEMTE